MDQRNVRAADADRERVAERLRAALNEGRLDLTEFDERLQLTYAAKTYADLAPITADLPSPAPVDAAQVAVPVDAAQLAVPESQQPEVDEPTGSRAAVASWAGVSVITIGIWAASSLSATTWLYFWPVWVIVPWGAVILGKAVTGLGLGRTRPDRRRQ